MMPVTQCLSLAQPGADPGPGPGQLRALAGRAAGDALALVVLVFKLDRGNRLIQVRGLKGLRT